MLFASSLPDHLRPHQPYGDPGPAVVVAASRTPQAIAADLRRRLLPRHRAYLAQVTTQATAAGEEQTRTAEPWMLLLQILTNLDARCLEHSQLVMFGQVGDLIEGDARVQPCTSTVTFVLDIQPDHAPRLARVLAALNGTCHHDPGGGAASPPTHASADS